MVVYNFKSIAVVPSAKDFVDIVLSKTQRGTPTVVRKGWKISRIRSFYMRKVKFTQQTFHDKISQIIDSFPVLDELHPFYSDLINVLYSRDHYKLALGQLNTARQLIDKLSKDYVHLIKFGDSLYRCQQLKRAALGRMCTLMKRLRSSLGYLEQVRQHLSRLPSIDPNTRTILITGYPNVGKSSFINKVSRADVEVQPYAFTTKSVFVGHFDYKYLRWQVIDTPGILDHPLEERNTIEMQAITALAHLQSCVLFFIDISEQCGYTIRQQVALYHNIKPLFANKPMLVVANKTDLRTMDELDDEDRGLIQSVVDDRNTTIIPMSNVSEEGINTVKSTACDQLLQFRVDRKLRGKRINDVVNRIHVARPVPRDNKERGVFIPESVRRRRAQMAVEETEDEPKRVLERDVEQKHGGPGVYNPDPRRGYLLSHDDWKWDIIPEIMDGHNIADWIDPDIDARLAELEREEAELDAEMDEEDDEELVTDGQRQLAKEIKARKTKIILDNLSRKTNNKPTVPRRARSRSEKDLTSHLDSIGVDSSKARARSKKRKHTALGLRADAKDDDGSSSRARSSSRAMTPGRSRDDMGLRNVRQKTEAKKMAKQAQKQMNLDARAGEGDRRYFNPKPKHLFVGKRGIGKTDRR